MLSIWGIWLPSKRLRLGSVSSQGIEVSPTDSLRRVFPYLPIQPRGACCTVTTSHAGTRIRAVGCIPRAPRMRYGITPALPDTRESLRGWTQMDCGGRLWTSSDELS